MSNEKIPRPNKKKIMVDRTVVLVIDCYDNILERARFMYREDEMYVTCYWVVVHIKAYKVEHIYKVARVQLAAGLFVNSKTSVSQIGRNILSYVNGLDYQLKVCLSSASDLYKETVGKSGVHIGKSTINKYT